MAKNLANVGGHVDSFVECKNEGYGNVACAAAIGAKEAVTVGCLAGGTAMISSNVTPAEELHSH